LSLGLRRLANLYENKKGFEKKILKIVVVYKNNHLAQKIFQNPVVNLKGRKIHESFESKKYIMSRISRNGYFLIRFFAQISYLQTSYKNFEIFWFLGDLQIFIFYFFQIHA
jgi:hypothetical protein